MKSVRTNLRVRLDQVLVERGLVETRAKARGLILAGEVLVEGIVVDKPGTAVLIEANITLTKRNPYVSRGGLKLKGALDALSSHLPQLEGAVALDIGASTGGFTDCLLQHGVRRVYAVDVGHGQLDWRLRNDPRVKVYERTNIRELSAEALGEQGDLIVIDVSFISILKFLDRLSPFLKPHGRILCLVKPQFEGKRAQVGKGGVIRKPEVVAQIVANFISQAALHGFHCLGETPSPIAGAKGNQEVFVLVARMNENG